MTNSENLLDQILRAGPSPGTLFLVLFRMKEEARWDRLIQECIRALEFYPEDIPIRLLLSEAYFESGRIGQAEEEIDRVVARIHDLMVAYRLRARIYARQKRDRDAIEALEIFLAHRPGDPKALDLLNTLGQTDEVRPREEKTPPPEEAFPEEDLPDIATPTLAEIYFKQGRIREAVDIYERVVFQNPEDEKSRNRLEQLRAVTDPETATQEQETPRGQGKREKMIAVLEQWRTHLRELTDRPPPG
ncbi:MAG: tetratricopeptide repeat protein [Deltaproteobacteria bacterium]|nr:tetratricopeptide repeat protein [Deltaproteobacteria bacterium]